MEQIVVAALFFQMSLAGAMLIPEEIEMLDEFGYISSFPNTVSEDDYFEARSLSVGPLFDSVRNERSVNYDEKESQGLISYFHPNTLIAKKDSTSTYPKSEWLKKKIPHDDNEKLSDESSHTFGNMELSPSRRRRNLEHEEKIETMSSKEGDKFDTYAEDRSREIKQTKKTDELHFNHLSTHNSPITAALVGKFTRSPFEYSKIHHEGDSMPMDTSSLSMNEGTKSRTPRVNFVTQQKKSLDHDDTKVSATKSDFYKTPPLLHNSKEFTDERRSTVRSSSEDRNSNHNHYEEYFFYFSFNFENY